MELLQWHFPFGQVLRSVCHNFLKGREVTLPRSYRSTCFILGLNWVFVSNEKELDCVTDYLDSNPLESYIDWILKNICIYRCIFIWLNTFIYFLIYIFYPPYILDHSCWMVPHLQLILTLSLSLYHRVFICAKVQIVRIYFCMTFYFCSTPFKTHQRKYFSLPILVSYLSRSIYLSIQLSIYLSIYLTLYSFWFSIHLTLLLTYLTSFNFLPILFTIRRQFGVQFGYIKYGYKLYI